MNKTSMTPQQDDTKANGKSDWIKPELIQLLSQDTEGKGMDSVTEASPYIGIS